MLMIFQAIFEQGCIVTFIKVSNVHLTNFKPVKYTGFCDRTIVGIMYLRTFGGIKYHLLLYAIFPVLVTSNVTYFAK